MAPPGGEAFDVVLAIPLADSSGGNPRDLTSNAPVTVAEVDTCGNGVTDSDLPTQITLEFFALPCNEYAYYRVWINGTQVFNQLYAGDPGDPNTEHCYGYAPCGYPFTYRSVTTTNPAHLAALADGTNSIRFQMNNDLGFYQHVVMWALLKITRPGGTQYLALFDGYNASAALAHDTNWCSFGTGVYEWDMTSNYDIDILEACDDGLANGTCGNCNANCSGPYNTCGDATVRCGETCNDGPGGSCNDDCSGGICGDGVVYGSEVCDSGSDNGTCGFCRSNCTGPYNTCGDGAARCGEVCDDGPGGTCHEDCTAVNVCGDGRVFAGETCDEGALNGTCGHCNATCNGPHNVCGDGQALCGEDCDDGNTTECGLCNATCTDVSPADVCGDGIVCGGEVCDDGDNTFCGLCNPYCTAASAADTCGDGLVCGAETCDDGNTSSLDGCESNCQLICGMGTGAKKATMDTVSGDCFLGFDDTANWQDSETLCEAVSDRLATPSTASGNAAAFVAATSSSAWIGISDLAAEAGFNGSLFQYVNGGYVTYNGWTPAQPDGSYVENCVQFADWVGNGTWNDLVCWQEKPRVCEISHCGNGVVDAGEACDDGNATNCGTCNSNCTGPSPSCGDGVLGCGEACDDGNTVNDDGCESNCQLACGAGTGAVRAVLDAGNNTCDLGFASAAAYGPSQAACVALGGHLAVIDSAAESTLAWPAFPALPGVAAWLGFNDITTEALGNPYQFQNVLGGSLIFSGFAPGDPNDIGGNEDCVLMGADSLWYDIPCHYGVGSLCEIPAAYGVCGDGVHNLGEACDDGNVTECGTCNATCTMVKLPDFCGDGVLCGSEVCDDGNNTECGACNASCSGPSTHCGNGTLDCGETCDDGNTVVGDGCEDDCQLACGAGTGAFRASYDAGSNSCYLGFTAELNYPGSQAACVAKGGHLAVIDSAAENALARLAFPPSLGVAPWIGFNDMAVEALGNAYQFMNVLGGYLVYNGFYAGQPDDAGGGEDCVVLATDGAWHDLPCSWGLGSICEMPTAFGVCGDGVRNLDEACDDGNTTECGTCNATCTGPSAADSCGDGLVCGAEVCDDGPYNGLCGHCSTICTGPFNTCGDGIARCGEACDDGNAVTNDGCEPDCELICGVGSGASKAVLETSNGTCYLGYAGAAPYLTQRALCQGKGGYLAILDSAAESALASTVRIGTPFIGFNDLALEAGANAFAFKNVLGGNLVYNGFAPGQPDNFINVKDNVVMNPTGQWSDISGVSSFPAICEIPVNPGFCGNGVVGGAEECDDFANANQCDGCMLNCRKTCGNGVVDCGEACDDGEAQGQGLCLNNCTAIQSCGNGVINGDENCDDGNAAVGDGCSAICQAEPMPCLPTNVAVFRDYAPYGTVVESVLSVAGIPYTVYPSSWMGGFSLAPYDKVVIAENQLNGGTSSGFYSSLMANAGWFNSWISSGGVFEFHTTTASPQLNGFGMPGGWQWLVEWDSYYNTIDPMGWNAWAQPAMPLHPILRYPWYLNDSEMSFTNPSGMETIGQIIGAPTGSLVLYTGNWYNPVQAAVMPYGSGLSIVTAQRPECMAAYNPECTTYGASGPQYLRNLLLHMPQQTCP